MWDGIYFCTLQSTTAISLKNMTNMNFHLQGVQLPFTNRPRFMHPEIILGVLSNLVTSLGYTQKSFKKFKNILNSQFQ